jgi:hypothetical protein
MARVVAPWVIRWGIQPLMVHGRVDWVTLLQIDGSCWQLLQQEPETSPRALVISMEEGARRVVGQHRQPPWVQFLYVPAASTVVEGVRLFALLRRCLLAKVSDELRWSCSMPLGGCLCRLCVIMFYPSW